MKELIEYMKLHLISLEQDSEGIWNAMDQIDDLNSEEYEKCDKKERQVYDAISHEPLSIEHAVKLTFLTLLMIRSAFSVKLLGTGNL
ncbi:MAG: hypothetical protein EBW83_07300 [Rhodobacterales bacterium]|nr:hypothetical protein [Rhodobacterales bacterium]